MEIVHAEVFEISSGLAHRSTIIVLLSLIEANSEKLQRQRRTNGCVKRIESDNTCSSIDDNMLYAHTLADEL